MTSEDVWGEGQVHAELSQLQRRGNLSLPASSPWLSRTPPTAFADGRSCCRHGLATRKPGVYNKLDELIR